MEKDFQKIINHYNGLYKKYGYSDNSIGWGKNRKILRYHILCSKFNLNNRSILDFGCGFGDLSEYLSNHYSDFKYIGIDINENFINEAKKQYPEVNFFNKNIFEDKIKYTYDYVVSSGVHNTKIENNFSFIERTIDIFDKISDCGFAMNFLSKNVDYMEENLYYADPTKVVQLAMKYSNNFLIRHDYMPYEFTLIVIKDKKVDKDLNIYEDFVGKL
tara:strand:+ start:1683 stop:2330 length:648 start_codon:yes stop_codon:yes gene_type:complete